MNTALHSARRVSRPAAGFTLIELLLAISIMTMVLAAMSSVLYIAYRLHTGVTDAIEQSLPVEKALAFLQRDLANIVCNNASNNIMLIGSFQTVNLTNRVSGQIQGSPDFYTTGGQPDGLLPWGDVEKVNYLLVPSTNRSIAGSDLVRAVTHNLLPVNPPTQPDARRVILSGVRDVQFSFYDGSAWDQNWDSMQQTNLPNAIKMQITMYPQNSGRMLTQPKVYELYIPVDVQMSTNLTSAIP
jgi:type II secretion system protein J